MSLLCLCAFVTLNKRLLTYLLTVVQDRPIMSVKYCLSVPVFHFCTMQRVYWPALLTPPLSAFECNLNCPVICGISFRNDCKLIFSFLQRCIEWRAVSSRERCLSVMSVRLIVMRTRCKKSSGGKDAAERLHDAERFTEAAISESRRWLSVGSVETSDIGRLLYIFHAAESHSAPATRHLWDETPW